jgi:hypothetical protein
MTYITVFIIFFRHQKKKHTKNIPKTTIQLKYTIRNAENLHNNENTIIAEIW